MSAIVSFCSSIQTDYYPVGLHIIIVKQFPFILAELTQSRQPVH